MHRSVSHCIRRFAFPFCCWALAVLYLLVASGVPFPQPSNLHKDTSTPFPCMDSACGCRDSEQCWRSCCCHTLSERLAWARQNHIRPPEFVVAEAHSKGLETDDCREHSPACCESSPNCCQGAHECHKKPVATASCCAKRNKNADRSVVLTRALKCRGISGDWLGMGAALVPPRLDFQCDQILCDWLVQATASLSSTAFPPPLPPPRSSVV